MGLSRMMAFGAEPDVYYPPTAEEIKTAWDQIRTARKALYRLDYWFDADAEILEAMSRDELAAHDRLRGLVRDALQKLEDV